MSINEIIVSIDNFVWGMSLIILSLGSGLLFSITLKWVPKYDKLEQIIETAWNWHKNHPNGYED